MSLIDCQCLECDCDFSFEDFPQVCEYCRKGAHKKNTTSRLVGEGKNEK